MPKYHVTPQTPRTPTARSRMSQTKRIPVQQRPYGVRGSQGKSSKPNILNGGPLRSARSPVDRGRGNRMNVCAQASGIYTAASHGDPANSDTVCSTNTQHNADDASRSTQTVQRWCSTGGPLLLVVWHKFVERLMPILVTACAAMQVASAKSMVPQRKAFTPDLCTTSHTARCGMHRPIG